MDTSRRQFLKTAATVPAAACAQLAAPNTALSDAFRSPGKLMRPVIWYYPGKWETEAIDADLKALQQMGLGGIVVSPTGRGSQYLSEAFWQDVRKVVDRAAALDMRIWIYDELGYPSGSAGGATIKSHPEYETTQLEYHEVPARDGRVEWTLPQGELVLAVAETGGKFVPIKDAVSGGRLLWNAPAGGATVHVFVKRVEDVIAKVAHGRGGLVRPVINLLDANATREFISNTYEGYERAVGRYFGKQVEAFFTDEPCLHTAGYWQFREKAEDHQPMLPWVDGFAEYFFARKGYEIVPLLPCLIKYAGPDTAKVRCDYWDVVATLIADSYYGELQQWCARHHVASSGHSLLEEGLMLHLMFTGSLIRAISRQDIAGMDMIGPRPTGKANLEESMFDGPGLHLSPLSNGGMWVGKFVSSAAHTRGKSEVMSESFAASQGDLTLDKMVAMANWQYVAGVTELMPMHENYGRRRLKPDAGQAEFFKDPGFYAAYLGRCKTMLTGGVHVADVAMLVPEASVWANYVPAPVTMPYEAFREKNPVAAAFDDAFTSLSMELLHSQIDHDYLDDEAFELAEVADGKVKAGKESYGIIVMPPASIMRAGLVEKIDRFHAGGGCVVACGELPRQAMERGKDERVQRTLARVLAGPRSAHVGGREQVPAAVRRMGEPDVLLKGAPPRIYYIHKRKDGRDIYFLINMTREAARFGASFHCAAPVALWDPRTGEMRRPKAVRSGKRTSLDLRLDGLSGLFCVFG